VAIACRDDADWARLRALIGGPAHEERFDAVVGRLAAEDALDRVVEEWTSRHERYALADRLAAAGVPAAPVQNARDRVERDPQLRARGYFVPLRHSETGEHPQERPPFRLSACDVHPGGRIRRGPPCIGEDTQEVLRSVLGMTDAEIAALGEAGVLA
jgi:crotonobetainyl-CoA:carnitine CoA-transferase CaiB-like acyl-CoA transferase